MAGITPGPVAEIIPETKGLVFNEAVGANADIFAAALAPTHSPTTFRIYACFDTAGVLIVRRTRGTPPVTVSEQLNSGVDLNANAAYMFDIIVQEGDSLNLWHSIGATILYLKVVEIAGAIG